LTRAGDHAEDRQRRSMLASEPIPFPRVDHDGQRGCVRGNALLLFSKIVYKVQYGADRW
jgi:hypothetical protein